MSADLDVNLFAPDPEDENDATDAVDKNGLNISSKVVTIIIIYLMA